MYFWNYKKLAETLRDGTMGKKSYATYVVIFVVLNLLCFPIPIVWMGIAYYINRKGDNKSFWRRYISLLTPVTLRSWGLAVPIAIMVAVIFGAASIISAMNNGNAGPVVAAFTGNTGKGIATIFVTLVGIWCVLIYPIIIYVKGFRIASGQVR